MGSGAKTSKWETVGGAGAEGQRRLSNAGAKFTVRRPGVPEVELAVETDEFLIGRLAAEVDLVLDDDLVSRKHAALTLNDGGYFILKDLGSKNGIEYEGRPVRRLNLVDGDEFKIGKTAFTFHAKIDRFDGQTLPAEPEPPPRADSALADIDVPAPAPDPADEAGTPVGWDPEAAKAGAKARAIDAMEQEAAEIAEEESGDED